MCVINLFDSSLCVNTTEFVGSVSAFSTDIIFIFDCISVPDVFISATARYLLSLDMVVSSAIVVDKYVLKSSFPPRAIC